jgi:hypothetical protein
VGGIEQSGFNAAAYKLIGNTMKRNISMDRTMISILIKEAGFTDVKDFGGGYTSIESPDGQVVNSFQWNGAKEEIGSK